MKTSSISLNNALLSFNKITKNLEKASTQLSTTKKVASSEDNPTYWAKAKRNRYSANSLQAVNDSLNTAAISVRTASLTMDTIGDTIDQMKALLTEVTQNYSESTGNTENRASLIKSFNTLRGQIDKMADLSGDDNATKIMGNPNDVNGAGDITVLINGNGTTAVIHSQEVDTGETGINIPELSEDATDEEIAAAISNLRDAKDKLISKQKSLEIDALAISAAQNYNTNIINNQVSFAEDIENADTNAVAVELKSLEIQQSLATQALSSLINSRSSLLNLWG